ncbi:hypothetical protein Q73_00355 [Bacillus coahuilensis m2-6]|uniref:hypothetical protein n=1 Tax=Bacillus coahuilensis TaxID=408580 RepID=UPI0007500DD7|nr:hypothetical protein [Bacillus coahuilensis]KUP09925.1 hypothetical protein Q73_00355 [Bacillus coahuilensis m2-6]
MKKYGSLGLLVLGGILMVLSNGKFLLASAAWVFPVLFLFAIKEWNWKVAVVALGVVTAVSNQLSFHGMLPSLPIPFFEYIPAMAGFLYAIPFILQKIAFQKSHRFIATLILPSTYALVDYANQYINPYGTFGLLGYSQHGNLPILQVASVVGVTGIPFIIMWTASIVYWLSLAGKRQSKRIVIGVLLTAMLAIVIGGGLRGSVASDAPTVLTSGIHTVDRNDAEVLEIYNLHEKDLNDFLQKSEERMDELIELTTEEARGRGEDYSSF